VGRTGDFEFSLKLIGIGIKNTSSVGFGSVVFAAALPVDFAVLLVEADLTSLLRFVLGWVSVSDELSGSGERSLLVDDFLDDDDLATEALGAAVFLDRCPYSVSARTPHTSSCILTVTGILRTLF
jgi:hypothetical protein